MNHYACVTGGRNYADRANIESVLWTMSLLYEDRLRVLHGAAPGTDTIAGEVCAELGIVVKPFPADWDRHGNAAGPIRNKQMVDYLVMCRTKGHTVQVVAFPGGTGTADLIRAAHHCDIDVFDAF